jgi:hypothetical protein
VKEATLLQVQHEDNHPTFIFARELPDAGFMNDIPIKLTAFANMWSSDPLHYLIDLHRCQQLCI